MSSSVTPSSSVEKYQIGADKAPPQFESLKQTKPCTRLVMRVP